MMTQQLMTEEGPIITLLESLIARVNSEVRTAAEDFSHMEGQQGSRQDLTIRTTIVVDSMLKVMEQGVVINLEAMGTTSIKVAATSDMSSKCIEDLVKWVHKVTLPQVMVGQGL